MEDPAAPVLDDQEAVQHWNVTVGTVKKSNAAIASR
jgi:hypothetical protein